MVMFRKFARPLPLMLAAALAIGVMAPGAVHAGDLKGRAGAPVDPSSEARDLGVQIAHLLFNAMDMKGVFLQEMRKDGGMDDFAKARPSWPRLMAEATAEEMDAKMPQIEALVGQAMAKYFTLEEMRAGVVIMGDSEMQDFIRRRSTDESAEFNARALSPATRKALASGAGLSFTRKFGDIDVALDPITGEMGAILIPGVFRRFADKADAETQAQTAP